MSNYEHIQVGGGHAVCGNCKNSYDPTAEIHQCPTKPNYDDWLAIINDVPKVEYMAFTMNPRSYQSYLAELPNHDQAMPALALLGATNVYVIQKQIEDVIQWADEKLLMAYLALTEGETKTAIEFIKKYSGLKAEE